MTNTTVTAIIVGGLAAVISASPGAAQSDLIINGSFEDFTTSVDCAHLGGEEFNEVFPHVYHQGRDSNWVTTEAQPCGSGSTRPFDGRAKVGMFVSERPAGAGLSTTDRVGGVYGGVVFELSEPLIPGELYTLEGYTRSQPRDEDYKQGWLEFTVAVDPPTERQRDYGELVAWTGSPGEDQWELTTRTFEAPIAANYVGVRAAIWTIGEFAFINIDNFSLFRSAVPTESQTWREIKTTFRDTSTDLRFR